MPKATEPAFLDATAQTAAEKTHGQGPLRAMCTMIADGPRIRAATERQPAVGAGGHDAHRLLESGEVFDEVVLLP